MMGEKHSVDIRDTEEFEWQTCNKEYQKTFIERINFVLAFPALVHCTKWCRISTRSF